MPSRSLGGIPMDAPIPIGQPLINSSTSKPTPKLQMKTVLKFIILLVILFLISTLALSIFLGKKKITPLVTSTRTSTTTKSSSPQATTATTSMNSINTLMISSTTSESKPNGCQLPLIPTYNSNKVIVAGGDSPGSSLHELNRPIALALDSKSNLFVLDFNNFRVMKYTPNSKEGEIVLGNGSDRFPRAANIMGLVINENDVLYTCQNNDTVKQFIFWPSSSKNGTIMTTMSGGCSMFTIDQNSNIYILSRSDLYIYYPPRYKEYKEKRILSQSLIFVEIPTGSSTFYFGPNNILYAIDMRNRRILKSPLEDEISEIIVDKSPPLLAITVDCHNNVFAIDSNASLIIYNSTGDVISTMHNAIDNPTHFNPGSFFGDHPPDYAASLALDFKTGDLYVAMYGYDRVTKFSLNK